MTQVSYMNMIIKLRCYPSRNIHFFGFILPVHELTSSVLIFLLTVISIPKDWKGRPHVGTSPVVTQWIQGLVAR